MMQQCIVFLMLLVRVIAVSMSTRRNMDKFGAPIGSVNCSFINVYNSEQLLYDLQNIIIRDSVHLAASNLVTMQWHKHIFHATLFPNIIRYVRLTQ